MKKCYTLKKIITQILVFSVVLSMVCIPVNAENADFELPSYFTNLNETPGRDTPFKPDHMYGSMQNVPNFSWPAVDGASSYELIICRDEALTDIAYKEEGIENHYFNFSYTFEPGTYWWAVRAKAGNKLSEWSAGRRFRIDKDAHQFVLPDVKDFVNSIDKVHPRLFILPDTIDDLREKMKTETGKIIKGNIIDLAENFLANDIPEEPILIDSTDAAAKNADLASKTNLAYSMGDRLSELASAYILTGEEKYFKGTMEAFNQFCGWDYKNPKSVASMQGNDQVFMQNFYQASLAYDWLYNDMTAAERKKIGDMLYDRFQLVSELFITSIHSDPYESHMWSHSPWMGVASIALIHDYPGVDEYLGRFLKMYFGHYVPMSYEDGGWAKGTQYWTFSLNRDKALGYLLEESGYLNFFNMAQTQNEYLWAMYMMPPGSFGSFGDGAVMYKNSNNADIIEGFAGIAKYTKNPVAAWYRDKIGPAYTFSRFDAYGLSPFFVESYDIEPKEPIEYPRAFTFVDQGTTAMHSELIDDNRISCYFRSSRYGSYGHLEADNNAFIIEANGETLAAKSGIYDSYHSAHNSGFTRKTYAHNSITYNMGEGQRDDDIDADGNTDMFVTQSDFDAVVGDATPAYKGNLGKFVRSMIYVRPDTYIVIDDLKAGQEAVNFEWWLNSGVNNISLHDDGRGAIINGRQMTLSARIHYPENIKAFYSDLFSGPDLINYEPMGGATYTHKRMWFETDKLEETKIISTMNVHHSDNEAKFVKTADNAEYMTLEFEDGTIAVINKTSDNDKLIDTGNVAFRGTAVVYNEDSIMLVGGKELSMFGVKLIESENTVTVVYGKGQLGFSANEDYKIKIYSGNAIIGEINNVVQRKENSVREPVSPELTGFGVEYEENAVVISAQKGHYSTLLNDTQLPGADTGEKISLELVVDGKSEVFETDSKYNSDYIPKGSVTVPLETGYYTIVSKTDGVNPSVTLSMNNATAVSGEVIYELVGKENKIELKSLDTKNCEITAVPEYEELKASLTAIVEAENFDNKMGVSRLTAGLSYLTGISKFDTVSDEIYYTVNIPEEGDYDIAFRYAAWQEPLPERTIEIGGRIFICKLPLTGGWGGNGPDDFKGCIVHSNVHLTAGEHTFKLGVVKDGATWNYDWIGFIKK